MVAGGGSGGSWTMEFKEGEWDAYQDEKGWLPICVFEMSYYYTGEWRLDF